MIYVKTCYRVSTSLSVALLIAISNNCTLYKLYSIYIFALSSSKYIYRVSTHLAIFIQPNVLVLITVFTRRWRQRQNVPKKKEKRIPSHSCRNRKSNSIFKATAEREQQQAEKERGERGREGQTAAKSSAAKAIKMHFYEQNYQQA